MIYLDHAASSPLLPAAKARMSELEQRYAGLGLNPSALHAMGRAAREILEQARAEVAHLVGAQAAEIVFTGGGTEADALAIRGAASGALDGRDGGEPAVWVSAIEHPAVAAAASAVGAWQIPVNSEGGIDLGHFQERCLRAAQAGQAPAIVSVMAVNNEVGTIQPVAEVAQIVRQTWPGPPGVRPLVHTDAIQAAGKIDLDWAALGVDMMSLSAHKFGGPAGIGALVIGRDVALVSDRLGGGQERKLRSGTQDVIAAAGFGAAATWAGANLGRLQANWGQLRERLVAGITTPGVYPSVARAAATTATATARATATVAATVANIIHLRCDGAEAEAMLMAMDMRGVCVSAGSACHAGVARPSSVLIAMGVEPEAALGVLRVSLGWNTTAADIDGFLDSLDFAVQTSRRFRGKK